MYNYQLTRLYGTDEEFCSRWQTIGNESLFIHKDSLVWLNGRTITIPKQVGDYFFFGGQLWLQVKEDRVHLGQGGIE